MRIKRKRAREVRVGKLILGGNNPVRVQSMCNTRTRNAEETIKQISQLEEAGCEIARIAVPDLESAKNVGKIRKQAGIPIVADIHYDYKLALECLKQGIDKIRINPGNIAKDKLRIIAREAKNFNVPIRIGINAGSLPKYIAKKFGCTPKGMAESALDTAKLFESQDFYDAVVSLKSSDVLQTIDANLLFSEKSDYPLHLGVTESGTLRTGAIKSAVAIGYLLLRGIGDTARISLTANPVEEVYAGYALLKSLGLREGAEIVSCPTCARKQIDVIKIASQLEKYATKIKKPVKIAVLGCFVNAEEAKHADIGIAGAQKHGIIFSGGKALRKARKDKAVEELLKEISKKYNLKCQNLK